MPNYLKKISFFLLAVFILTAIFSPDFVQASLWNIIRAWVTINPLAVDVSVPSKVEVDKVFNVEAKIINKGEEKIEKVKGEIFLSEGLVLLEKNLVQEIGVIPGKKEKKVSWRVKGVEIGVHIIIVSASGELKGNSIRAEDTATIEVKENIPPSWKHRLERFFDFFSNFFYY